MYTFIAVCAHQQDMQRRVQKDIDDVVRDRMPAFSDKENLPIMESFIFETLRYSSQTPLSIPHKTIKDVTLNSYTLPKGTEVGSKLYFCDIINISYT